VIDAMQKITKLGVDTVMPTERHLGRELRNVVRDHDVPPPRSRHNFV
jgi:hypothetical protein